MSFLTKFLQKKTSYIPVEPVKYTRKKTFIRANVEEVGDDVFEIPTDEPKTKIVHVKSAVVRISEREKEANLAENSGDIKKESEKKRATRRSAIKQIFTESIPREQSKPMAQIETKPIERLGGRPKRIVTMTTKTNSAIKLTDTETSTLTEARPTKLTGNKSIKLIRTIQPAEKIEESNLPQSSTNSIKSDPAIIQSTNYVPSQLIEVKSAKSQSSIPIKRTSRRLSTGITTSPPSVTSCSPLKKTAISSVKPLKVKHSSSVSALKRPISTRHSSNKKLKSNDGGNEVFEIEVFDVSENESFEGDESDFDLEDEPSNKRRKKNKAKSTTVINSKSSRWDRIKQVLQSGGTIEALPGRIDEFEWIKRTVVGLLESCLGGCLYISGVPGTGKTATTHRTLDSLTLAALKGECPDFDFVEINGMRLSDPGQAYSILARTIFKKKVPTNGASALKMLESHFKEQQKTKKVSRPCVVLLDELDLLLRKRQSLLYHFFEWPNWTNSQLIVITIANTMDLPERFLSNRISSRLGLTRYNFKPYDHAALSNIIEHQLKDYVKYLGKDAIQLCARKVSAVSGDARRAVNLAKRAVDYFRSATQEELQAKITGRQVLEKVPEGSQLSSVNLRLMDVILKEALMANPVEIIAKLSKHQRILLLSVILARKRAEEEVSIRGGTKIIGKTGNNNNVILTVGRILDQHFQLCRTHQYHPLPSLQELYILLESLESLRLLRCLKFRESGPESIVQLLVHEEDIRKGLGDDQSLKKYIRE